MPDDVIQFVTIHNRRIARACAQIAGNDQVAEALRADLLAGVAGRWGRWPVGSRVERALVRVEQGLHREAQSQHVDLPAEALDLRSALRLRPAEWSGPDDESVRIAGALTGPRTVVRILAWVIGVPPQLSGAAGSRRGAAAVYGERVTDPTGDYRPPSDPLANPPPPPVDPYVSMPPADPYASAPPAAPYSSYPVTPAAGYPTTPASGYPSTPASGYPATPPGGYPVPTTGAGAGPASGDLAVYEPPLVSIGDITVTKNTVQVPHGRYPLRGTTWTVQDSTQVTESIPAYAIVLAIVFALFCLLGLLFLLIKEKRYTGFITVSVAGDGFYHSTQLPPGPTAAIWAHNQVNQARALAATAA